MRRGPAVAAGPHWLPNPFAIAEQLLGTSLDQHYDDRWASAETALEDAFGVKVQMIFDRADDDRVKIPALELFDQIARVVRTPDTIAAIESLPLVQAARKRFGPDRVERVLLFLVPVLDAVFADAQERLRPSGKRFAGEYQTLDRYTQGGATFLDPVQGGAADCGLIAAMSALAWAYPRAWPRALAACRDSSAPDSDFRFAFFRDGHARYPNVAVTPGVPAAIPLSGDVAEDSGPRLYYARSAQRNEGWPAILEKAYLVQYGRIAGEPRPADYQLLDHSVYPHHACQRLAGGRRVAISGGEADGVRPHSRSLRNLCDPRRGVTRWPTLAWTFGVREWNNRALTWARTGLFRDHCYTVLGLMTYRGDPYVVLRNPHGRAPYRPEGYADGEWTPGAGAQGVGHVQLNRMGVFALKASWFDQAFAAIGYVEPLQ